MMKKMKSMSAEAAAVRRLVLLSDEDDEPNRNDRTAQQEWNLLIHELYGSESGEERNDDMFANIYDANLALEKQMTVVEKDKQK